MPTTDLGIGILSRISSVTVTIRPAQAELDEPFRLAARPLAKNADVLEFIADGGYRDPRWWLSDERHDTSV